MLAMAVLVDVTCYVISQPIDVIVCTTSEIIAVGTACLWCVCLLEQSNLFWLTCFSDPITANDLDTDPFLGLQVEEPDSWTPTVGKEVGFATQQILLTFIIQSLHVGRHCYPA
jgi:hypothetical protein